MKTNRAYDIGFLSTLVLILIGFSIARHLNDVDAGIGIGLFLMGFTVYFGMILASTIRGKN